MAAQRTQGHRAWTTAAIARSPIRARLGPRETTTDCDAGTGDTRTTAENTNCDRHREARCFRCLDASAWPQRDSNPCMSRDHVFARTPCVCTTAQPKSRQATKTRCFISRAAAGRDPSPCVAARELLLRSSAGVSVATAPIPRESVSMLTARRAVIVCVVYVEPTDPVIELPRQARQSARWHSKQRVDLVRG